MSERPPVLAVRGLTVGFPSPDGVDAVLRGVDLEIAPGETLGIVGESGSGKSLTALAVLGLLPTGARVLGGEIHLDGHDVLGVPTDRLRVHRGGTAGFIFQDATSALDPSFTVGSQLVEALRAHRPGLGRSQARREAVELLDAVGLPDPDERVRQYPHQLSGGMRQRCMIAIAIANRPRLVIADEPTTALDVTLQAQILKLIKRMIADAGTALMLITHDVGVIAEMSDRIAVMYAGRVVETGPARETLLRPRHPYTAALLHSLPQSAEPGAALAVIDGSPPVGAQFPSGCAFHPRCHIRRGRTICAAEDPPFQPISTTRSSACHFPAEVVPPAAAPLAASRKARAESSAPILVIEGLTKTFRLGSSGLLRRRGRKVVNAVDGVDLVLRTGETFVIVGESGSGKTTVGRMIVGLVAPDSGRILFDGQDIPTLGTSALRQVRRNVQMVFQDPYSSLNPRKTAREVVAEPLRLHGLLDQAGWARVDSLLERVGIAASQFRRFPSEFSGGQRQRIAIARALALEPKLVVLDEPVSALDSSIQAQILNLIAELQREHGLTYLFISHDLAVVAHIADQIAVMHKGKVVELGTRSDIFDTPTHAHTKRLLESIPTIPTERDAPATEVRQADPTGAVS